MYCRKCGSQNEDSSNNCIQCGEPLRSIDVPRSVPSPQIPNYLVQSILVTLFCCLPLGIVSIVFAAQVNGKIQAGDIPGALSASKNAKIFCWISFGIGLAVTVIYLAIFIMGAVFGNA